MRSATPSRPSRRLYRWLVRFAVGALVFVGLLVALAAYESWVSQREWQDACAEMDRLDPGWRGDDIAARRTDLPDAHNSFLRAQAIAKRRRATGPLGNSKQID